MKRKDITVYLGDDCSISAGIITIEYDELMATDRIIEDVLDIASTHLAEQIADNLTEVENEKSN